MKICKKQLQEGFEPPTPASLILSCEKNIRTVLYQTKQLERS